MALNSAELLLKFFQSDLIKKDTFGFTSLWRAIADIEEHLPLWEAQGQDVQAFRESLPKWKRGVLNHVDPEGRVNSQSNVVEVQSGDLGVLRWAAATLRETGEGLDENAPVAIRAFIAEARRAVAADDSLPEKLRLHIARLLMNIEQNLDDYEITGGFSLDEALERLFGLLKIAESVSAEPNLWTNLWEEWVRPVAIGVVASAPSIAVTIAQITGVA